MRWPAERRESLAERVAGLSPQSVDRTMAEIYGEGLQALNRRWTAQDIKVSSLSSPACDRVARVVKADTTPPPPLELADFAAFTDDCVRRLNDSVAQAKRLLSTLGSRDFDDTTWPSPASGRRLSTQLDESEAAEIASWWDAMANSPTAAAFDQRDAYETTSPPAKCAHCRDKGCDRCYNWLANSAAQFDTPNCDFCGGQGCDRCTARHDDENAAAWPTAREQHQPTPVAAVTQEDLPSPPRRTATPVTTQPQQPVRRPTKCSRCRNRGCGRCDPENYPKKKVARIGPTLSNTSDSIPHPSRTLEAEIAHRAHSLVGDFLAVPGSWWVGTRRPERGRLFKCRIQAVHDDFTFAGHGARKRNRHHLAFELQVLTDGQTYNAAPCDVADFVSAHGLNPPDGLFFTTSVSSFSSS